MDSTTLDTLTQRLDRLERENRRLKRIGGVALIGLAAMALMGQAMPGNVAKVVEAEKLVLRDSSGLVRAVLDVLPGGPALSLYDQGGTLRTLLTQSAIGLMDGPQPRLGLAVVDGRPVMDFIGPTGRPMAQLAVRNDGGVGLRLGGVGPGDAELAVGADGSPELTLTTSRASALLKVAPSSEMGALAMLPLRDEARRARAIIHATADREPGVLLFDSGGKVSTFLSLTRVLVTGKDGRVWSAP